MQTATNHTSLADECLFMRIIEKRTVVVCVYIDDILCLGDKESIFEYKNQLMLHFAIKEEGEMKEYVGCKVKKLEKQVSFLETTTLSSRVQLYLPISYNSTIFNWEG